MRLQELSQYQSARSALVVPPISSSRGRDQAASQRPAPASWHDPGKDGIVAEAVAVAENPAETRAKDVNRTS